MGLLTDKNVCSWFVRLTRFGTTHLVRSQVAGQSCGINAVMMALCRMNKWTLIADGNSAEEQVYPKYDAAIKAKKQYKNLHAGAYDGNEDTYAYPLRDVLNNLGIGKWEALEIDETDVPKALIDSASFFNISSIPVLVLVTFPGKFSHWVLVDYTFNVFGTQYAAVCDPWDAHVHVTKFQTKKKINYNVESCKVTGWSFDTPNHSYSTLHNGYFNGWIIRCKSMTMSSRAGKVFLGAGV